MLIVPKAVLVKFLDTIHVAKTLNSNYPQVLRSNFDKTLKHVGAVSSQKELGFGLLLSSD